MPKFVPKPGQMDYTHARWAPVIICALEYDGQILLVKRSSDMNLYPSMWNGIGGFLDDEKTLEEKVQEELSEELALDKSSIESITLGEIFDADDSNFKKTWVVHPVLVKVNTDQVKLDWEAEQYKWVSLEEAYAMDLVPSMYLVLDKLFKTNNKNEKILL